MIRVYAVRRKTHSIFNWLTVLFTKYGDIPTDKVPTHMLTTHIDPITQREIAFQSNNKGPHIMDFQKFISMNRVVLGMIEIPCTQSQLNRYLNRMYDNAHMSSYDVLGSIGIGLFRRLGVKFCNLFDDDSSFSCAELSLDQIENTYNIELGREALFGPLSAFNAIRSYFE